MPYSRIHIHLVWATRDCLPLLGDPVRAKLLAHMADYARGKQIALVAAGGAAEHLHALVNLGVDQNVAAVVSLLKGESAIWLNRQQWLDGYFSWQSAYLAVSVGESQVARVVAYIAAQERYHQTKPFAAEYDEFMRRYPFVND